MASQEQNTTLSNFTDNLTSLDIPDFVLYLNFVIALAGTCFNLLVVYAYVADREIRSVPVNFFIFCLSISDELTGISLLIHFIWVQNGAILPATDSFPCFLWSGLTVTSVLSSVFLVIVISWDRLQMVTHPFKHRQFTRRRAVLQVLVLWIYVLLYVMSLLLLAPVINDVFFNSENILIPCLVSSVDARFIFISIVLDAAIPLIVLLIINGLIGVRIGQVTVAWIERQRLEAEVVPTSTSSDYDTYIEMVTISSVVSEETFQPERKKIFKDATREPFKSSRRVYVKMRKTVYILFLFVIVYISCWIPLYMGFVVKSFMDVSPWVLQLLFIIVGLNSVINPFIYAFMSKKYRNRLALMLQCRVR